MSGAGSPSEVNANAPASGILQGTTGNPALDSISEALNSALYSTNTADSSASNILSTGLASGLQYLNTYLNTANAAIAPQTQASYSALDSYLGALGIPGFSQGAAAYASTQNQLAPLTAQQQNLQSQYNSAEQQWQSLLQQGQSGSIPQAQYQTAAQQLSQTLQSLQSQLTPLNQQISTLQNSSANQVAPAGSTNSNTVMQQLAQSPIYTTAFNQGEQALQQSALQKGTLNTSGTQAALVGYGQNMGATFYQQEVGDLQQAALGLAPAATQTATQTANAGTTATNAQLTTSAQQAANQMATGTSQANAYIGAGSALSAIYQGIQQQNSANSAASAGGAAFSSGFAGGSASGGG